MDNVSTFDLKEGHQCIHVDLLTVFTKNTPYLPPPWPGHGEQVHTSSKDGIQNKSMSSLVVQVHNPSQNTIILIQVHNIIHNTLSRTFMSV